MILRIWRTGLDESRSEEYERFVETRSRPMFRNQPGLLGVWFARANFGRAVITIWRDEQSLAELGESQEYLDTVAAIWATGFLRPPQTVELLPVDRYWLPGAP